MIRRFTDPSLLREVTTMNYCYSLIYMSSCSPQKFIAIAMFYKVKKIKTIKLLLLMEKIHQRH